MQEYLYRYTCFGLFLHNKVHSAHTTLHLCFPTTINSEDPSTLVHINRPHQLYGCYYNFSPLPKDTKIPKDTRLLLPQTIHWSDFLEDLLCGTGSMRSWGWKLPAQAPIPIISMGWVGWGDAALRHRKTVYPWEFPLCWQSPEKWWNLPKSTVGRARKSSRSPNYPPVPSALTLLCVL